MTPSCRTLELPLFQRFLRCERAATAIEYGLIAGLTAVAAIPALGGMGEKIASTLEVVADALDGEPPGPPAMGGGEPAPPPPQQAPAPSRP